MDQPKGKIFALVVFPRVRGHQTGVAKVGEERKEGAVINRGGLLQVSGAWQR